MPSKRVRAVSFLQRRARFTSLIFLPFAVIYAIVLYLCWSTFRSGTAELSLLPVDLILPRIPVNATLAYHLEWNIPIPPKWGVDVDNLEYRDPTLVQRVVYNSCYSPLHIAGLCLLAAVVLHIITLLVAFWHVPARARVLFRNASPANATHALISPHEGFGKAVICRVVRTTRSEGNGTFVHGAHVFFQRRKFILDPSTGSLSRLPFPSAHRVSEYYRALGVGDDAGASGLSPPEIEAAETLFGHNSIEIPIPSLQELMLEHVMAPFFVFQVICCLLWMLDDFAFFSVFTLVMLAAMEAFQAFQRRKNMAEIQKMTPKPHAVQVFRSGCWTEVESTQLLPADIISLTSAAGAMRLAPADVLVLHGGLVTDEAALTGESAPQVKEALWAGPVAAADGNLDIARDKNHIAFSGTGVLQHVSSSASDHPAVRFGRAGLPAPPDGGAVCCVLRTGFESAQGRLVRQIAFETDRVSANSKEALAFILMLLQPALIAAIYTYVRGRETRVATPPKLLLEAILIVISVIPPELPTELSLAVNAALGELKRLFVYCTEPFRVPFAGSLTLCCFDKTGTLTQDEPVVAGVACAPGADESELPVDEASGLRLCPGHALPALTADVIGACHSLLPPTESAGSGKKARLLGDPLEAAAFDAAKFTLSPSPVPGALATCNTKAGEARSLHIRKRFAFSSALKRMTVVVEKRAHADRRERQGFILTKGAPEIVADLLTTVPADYHSSVDRLTLAGYRVLALAYREIPPHAIDTASLRLFTREQAETDLTFAGFLVVVTPLRPDTTETIARLRSAHRLMMVTGDNVFTATAVARECGILRATAAHPMLLQSVDFATVPHSAVFSPLRARLDADETVPTITVTTAEILDFAQRSPLVVHAGPALKQLLATENAASPLVSALVPRVAVYARTSPEEKAVLITRCRAAGERPCFVGDGSNDVGALKRASVGVALFETNDYKLAKRAAARTGSDKPKPVMGLREMYKEAKLRSRERHIPVPVALQQLQQEQAAALGLTPGARDENGRPLSLSEQMQRALSEAGDEGSAVARVGDASIAAPFTSKSGRVSGVLDIIRQGRCTLVTTLQMYKIQALTSLMNAYSLSVLTLDGVRYGDGQMTLQSLAATSLLMHVSRAKPRDEISARPPPSRVFSAYSLVSLFGQTLIHGSAIRAARTVARSVGAVPLIGVSLRQEFEPSVMNTVIFLTMFCMEVTCIVVNYFGGRPWLKEVPQMRKSIGFAYVASLVLTLQLVPEINEALRLVVLPQEAALKLAGILFGDAAIAFGIEQAALALLGPKVRVFD
jgi:cation-transporting ATPase 13A1